MLGDTIRDRREALGLTKAQLAAVSGITEDAVRKLEGHNRNDPYLSTVIKLARAFQISVSELLEETPPTKPQRNPEAEELIREWSGLPNEERAFTKELVRVLGKRPGKKRGQRRSA